MKETVQEAQELDAREAVTTMTGNGQITIPAAIRDALDLRADDEIIFELENNGSPRVILRPVRTAADRLRAAVVRRGQPLELDEARRLFEQDWPRQSLYVDQGTDDGGEG